MRQYMDKAAAAEELQVRNTFIATVFREVHKLVGNRYGPYTFRGSGRTEQIRSAVLTDYMRYRDALKDTDMAKYVPEFDVRAAEIELGISNTQVVTANAQEVADLVFKKIVTAIGGVIC